MSVQCGVRIRSEVGWLRGTRSAKLSISRIVSAPLIQQPVPATPPRHTTPHQAEVSLSLVCVIVAAEMLSPTS